MSFVVVMRGDDHLLFEKLCQNTFKLLIVQQVSIAIKVTIKTKVNDKFTKKRNEMQKIYTKYFDRNGIMQKYKVPQCNQFCVHLEEPFVSFVMKTDHREMRKDLLHVANAEAERRNGTLKFVYSWSYKPHYYRPN